MMNTKKKAAYVAPETKALGVSTNSVLCASGPESFSSILWIDDVAIVNTSDDFLL